MAGKTNKEDNLKKRGQTKTWTISDIKAKHKLTDEQWITVAQGIPLKPGKHVIGGKLNKSALMVIGKWIKNNPFPEPKQETTEDGKLIKELVMCPAKPANKRLIWVKDPNDIHGQKMVCKVHERVWHSHKDNASIMCEYQYEEGSVSYWSHYKGS